MKILNLYAGIGGNRKLWGDTHDITAVEMNEDIANIYRDFYPNDNVIVGDAHAYLLEHYKEYGFIWSSPPCPTHSDIRRCGVSTGQYDAKYPDMQLYQEIILLKHFAPCKWVVENVRPYYKPLIQHEIFLHRHLFWSNYTIRPTEIIDNETPIADITASSTVYGINLIRHNIKHRKDKILRNMVNPELGKYILDCAMNTGDLFD